MYSMWEMHAGYCRYWTWRTAFFSMHVKHISIWRHNTLMCIPSLMCKILHFNWFIITHFGQGTKKTKQKYSRLSNSFTLCRATPRNRKVLICTMCLTFKGPLCSVQLPEWPFHTPSFPSTCQNVRSSGARNELYFQVLTFTLPCFFELSNKDDPPFFFF